MVDQNYTSFLGSVKEKSGTLAEIRKSLLDKIAAGISGHPGGIKGVVFVCTHNSRRSQLAELLFYLACMDEGISLPVYSAGTEATALNERVARALQFWKMDLRITDGKDNPVYTLTLGDRRKHFFSKDLNHESLPDKDYAVITVCGDADRNCPVVPGASLRFHLPYIDPKAADNTPEESAVYIAKVLEIGAEMYYLATQLARNES